jgi:hypothetical protein
MVMTFDTYTVYVFPNGVKRLSLNMAGLTLKQLTLKYGTPIKTKYSYERVMEEGIR